MVIEEVANIVKTNNIINATDIMQIVRQTGIRKYDEWFAQVKVSFYQVLVGI